MIYFKNKTLWMVCLLPALLTGCSVPGKKAEHTDYFATDTTIVQSGGVRMIPVKTNSGTHKVWTKRIGNNPRTKVLLLSGGPGIPHDYLEVFENFFPAEGIEFYYYDEMGNGDSDNPGDTSRYNISAAVEELEQVRQALNLDSRNLYLFGHSWGGLLAMEYALKYQANLKALIISNMTSSGKEYIRYIQQELTKQMPPAVLDSITMFESRNEYDNPKYTDLITKHFYAKHLCRIPVEDWPEPMTRAMRKINAPYYIRLQGYSEFNMIGTLRSWDIGSRLWKITVPTLMIGARYDEMDPEHIKWMSEQVPHGHFLYCNAGSHLCMYDQQQVYMKGIIRFIGQTESRYPY